MDQATLDYIKFLERKIALLHAAVEGLVEAATLGGLPEGPKRDALKLSREALQQFQEVDF